MKVLLLLEIMIIDNDGYLDILLTGYDANSQVNISQIYRNDRNGTFVPISSNLTGVSNGDVAWGDYDNDGYIDILIVGTDSQGGNYAEVYRNGRNGTFLPISSILTGVYNGDAAWGDYDNDGDLDFLLNGWNGTEPVTMIYKNDDNNSFVKQVDISLTGTYDGAVVWWVDYDNDKDLDILITGWAHVPAERPVTKLYKNNNSIINTTPTPPTNLSSTIGEQEVTLNWDKSIDNETSQNGLAYNLVISTSPGGYDVVSPMADRTNGFRRVVALGNTNHNNSWTIKDLQVEKTYYWSVQAIDNNFAGSSFADEQTFNMVTDVDEIVSTPKDYYLNQNFPNPFNPTTTIKYDIKERAFVGLKIYDILGREAVVLINKEQNAGSYEVELNATELPSGVYFYQLRAGSFIKTKKMILLR